MNTSLRTLLSLTSVCLLLSTAALFAADSLSQAPADPDTCYKEAKVLAEQGKRDEAFGKFVWCYNHGVEVNPKFARTRDTRVLPLIASLAKKHPPAKAFLMERREAVLKEVKVSAGSTSTALAQQLAYLELNCSPDSVGILETIGQLQPGTPAYKAYIGVVQERLVETKNYREAASGENIDEVIAMMEKIVRNLDRMRQAGKFDDKAAEKMKNNAIKAAGGVEMYAGLGDLKHAKQLAELLLELSDHPDVRKAIVEHLNRAGAEGLAKKFDKK